MTELPQISDQTAFVEAWYPVCRSDALSSTKPFAATLCEQDVVVFRTPYGVSALLDRCPHRNIPLSQGRVSDAGLTCAYHGWRFAGDGTCVHIPCLEGDSNTKARRADAYVATEQDGLVWVYSRPNTEPKNTPFQFPHMDDNAYVKVPQDIEMLGSVFSVAENALDVPHTAFLHGGLFRKSERQLPIDVRIRRTAELVEAEYIGEPAPRGIVGRLLAPGGGVVEHFDRFLLPSVTQVEYRLGAETHLVITAALTPVAERKTLVFGVGALRTPLRRSQKVLAQIMRPLAQVVLRQDAKMLAMQTAAIEKLGEESVLSTDVDVLGPHIIRLMRDARLGKMTDGFEKELRMRV